MTPRSANTQQGFTLIELMCVIFLLTVLAGMALPVAHLMERRARELELRQELRTMRRAIDTYHFVVTVKAPQLESSASGDVAAKGWPEELEDLVEGIDLGLGADKRLRFLRRIPEDPLTGEAEWGKRSSSQDPDDDLWDSTNVFDVFSLAEGEGLDGTPYMEW